MAEPQTGRVLRGKAHANGVAAGRRVETANSLKAEDFFDTYFHKPARLALNDCASRLDFELVLRDTDTFDKDCLESCLSLIEQTSKDDYDKSEMKWKPAAKRKEMVLPDMRYLLLCKRKVHSKAEDDLSEVLGFCSFMVTYEDGYEVIYIYEIHLDPATHGQGLGKALMQAVESIGQELKISKVMLTVFRTNVHACRWYDRLGYNVDEFSPGPKRFRNGTVKESSYLILSKPMN